MKRFQMLIAATALMFALSNDVFADIISGPVVNPANGHTYYLLNSHTWTESESEAILLGGHLATINDQAENDWIFNTFSTFGNIDRALWIGLTDQSNEGTFSWASGEPVSFTNWSGGQPDDGGPGEDFVHLLWPGHSNQGAWNDFQDLDSVNGFVLNGVVEVVPEPSTLGVLISAVGFFTFCRRKKRRGITNG
jgi:hypothetical protein